MTPREVTTDAAEQARLQAERDDAYAIADMLVGQAQAAALETGRVIQDRREACRMLARLFDRFACAACVAGPQDSCPCGFADVGRFLNRPDLAEELDRHTPEGA